MMNLIFTVALSAFTYGKKPSYHHSVDDSGQAMLHLYEMNQAMCQTEAKLNNDSNRIDMSIKPSRKLFMYRLHIKLNTKNHVFYYLLNLANN